jgi:hypothetical protein
MFSPAVTPVTIIEFDTRTVLTGTPVTSVKLKAFGVRSVLAFVVNAVLDAAP